MKTRNRCNLNTFWFSFRMHFGSTLKALGSILATFWHSKTELKSMSNFVRNLKAAGASLSVQGCPGSPARASEGACRSVWGCLPGACRTVRGCPPDRLGAKVGFGTLFVMILGALTDFRSYFAFVM